MRGFSYEGRYTARKPHVTLRCIAERKNYMRFTSFLAAVMLFLGTLSVGASAAMPEGGFNERNEYGMPIVSCDTVLKQKEWNGKTRLKPDTCYFIDKPVSVTANNTLPEGSMIVVENGGKLTVKENVKLYVKGGVIVHSKASLVVKGRVILKSTSVSVINGGMTIGGKGRVSIYGNLQISQGGVMSVSGKAAVHNNGVVLSCGTIEKKSKAAAVPEYTEYGQDEMPLYYAEEYSDHLSCPVLMYSMVDDCGHAVMDNVEKLTLLRSFESVLYKYDGEFTAVSWWDLNPSFELRIPIDEDTDIYAVANYHNCLPLNVTESKEIESSDGTFYSSILGKVDFSLFAIVDPDSPNFIHGEFPY